MFEYRGNFEAHLTVEATADRSQLEQWCSENACKFSYIELSRGLERHQPMVSWQRHADCLSRLIDEANQRSAALTHRGLTVVRVKIETDPSNEDVPRIADELSRQPPENYFEHHIKLKRSIDSGYEALVQLCEAHGAHLSRNARRQSRDGIEERFVTTRDYGMFRAESDARLQALIAALKSCGEQVVEVESEYTVYDSKIELDAGWLKNGSPGPFVTHGCMP